MTWLSQLLQADTVPASLILLSAVAGLGLLLGNLRVFGISLGTAGVLFSGMLFGHFGAAVKPDILAVARDTGLVLFVYCIGVQVGPGFIASLRHNGLRLNLLAVAVVLTGCALTIGIGRAAGLSPGVIAGVYAGAVTNTPSLAAAQQAFRDTGADPATLQLPALGYAAAYPGGVLGIILSIMILRRATRNESAPAAADSPAPRRLNARNIQVGEHYESGLPLRELLASFESSAVVSRHYHRGELRVARPDSVVAAGDVLLAVGSDEELGRLCAIVGCESDMDLRAVPSPIRVRQIMVTRRTMQGHTIAELEIHLGGAVVTRLGRSNVEIPPSPGLRLQFGDTLQIVGEETVLDSASQLLGNSPKALDRPQLLPILIGIGLGVFLGSLPLYLPGMSSPVKLGLAGGPLIAAIVLSRIGRIGPLNWYLPAPANHTLRELGIAVFLACVGLSGGKHFADSVLRGDGVLWILCGAAVTVLPLLLAAALSRFFLRLDFISLSGLLAGSMTDPPALAFATTLTSSERTYVSYAAVYPLTMILRVVSAQLLVLYLTR